MHLDNRMIANLKRDPNKFGEMLRAIVFDCKEDEFGAYSTFKLIAGFNASINQNDMQDAFKALHGREYNPTVNTETENCVCVHTCRRDRLAVDCYCVCTCGFYNHEYDTDDLKASRFFSNSEVFVAWYCDGDTTLYFKLLSEGIAIVNRDAKKPHDWRFVDDKYFGSLI